MYRELTNLLPSDRSRALRHEYFLRLATVTLLTLSFVVVAAGVMLVPSYLSFTQEARVKQTELAQLAGTLEAAEEKEVGARLAQLEADVTHLNRLSSQPTASGALRAVLTVSREGISLDSFAYTPNTTAGENSLVLSGTATTRDALRRYNLALSALPFVSKSDLPISAYAKETELPFTITLTGTLRP